ncbi:hypothetical protein [Herbidospora cretacea]|nr:hypothetical protein [Herbidospora cretacea]
METKADLEVEIVEDLGSGCCQASDVPEVVETEESGSACCEA